MVIVKNLYRRNVSTFGTPAGKVAVVTGASEGIGKAIAVSLAKSGVKVALGARRKEVLDTTVQEIVANGGKAIGVQTDVVVREQVKQLVAKAEQSFGHVDILVNNAGVYNLTLMKNLQEDMWERQIDVNCKGLMNGIGAVLDGMIKKKSGHIINISSDFGRFASPGMAVYSGTKYFVEGMSQALRKEVAGLGVKVTTIQPGDTETPGIHQEFEAEAVTKMNSPQIPILQAQDVANAVLYALSQPDHVAVNEVLLQPKEYGAI